ncbi:MAG: hypothetical protein U0T81_08715 [Saprospiraceae bacterium]
MFLSTGFLLISDNSKKDAPPHHNFSRTIPSRPTHAGLQYNVALLSMSFIPSVFDRDNIEASFTSSFPNTPEVVGVFP